MKSALGKIIDLNVKFIVQLLKYMIIAVVIVLAFGIVGNIIISFFHFIVSLHINN